jgi:serine/threonine-protein kinase HipA
MRRAKVYMHGIPAGLLEELADGRNWQFTYFPDYEGPQISLTMPVGEGRFFFNRFPPFFEGLLPEGVMLEGMLRRLKIDRDDYFSQLMATGQDLVGAVTCERLPDE